MFFQLKSYLNFISKATNQHGVHSPFVFDLLVNCFYKESEVGTYKKVNAYLEDLLNIDTKIEVLDFGVGSKQLPSNYRSVKDIAKRAGISRKRSKLLIRLVHYLKAQEILEIGTSLGIGSASLAQGNQKARIISLEGCPATAKIAQDQLAKFGFNQVTIEVGEFNKTLPQVLGDKTFDLIYFDGNHQEKATIDYFNRCIHHVHNDTVFIFDDIYWSKGMSQAWKTVQNHQKVSVSIDTFRWGLLFFRKEQAKQHFNIRI